MKIVCGFPLFDKRSEAIDWYAKKYRLPKSIADHVINSNVESIKKFDNLRFLKGQDIDEIEFVNNSVIKDIVDDAIVPSLTRQLELSGIYYELVDIDFSHLISSIILGNLKKLEGLDNLMEYESIRSENSPMNKLFYFSNEFNNIFKYITLRKSEIKLHLQNSGSLDAFTKFVALYDDPEDQNDYIQIRLYPETLENISTLSDILFAI